MKKPVAGWSNSVYKPAPRRYNGHLIFPSDKGGEVGTRPAWTAQPTQIRRPRHLAGLAGAFCLLAALVILVAGNRPVPPALRGLPAYLLAALPGGAAAAPSAATVLPPAVAATDPAAVVSASPTGPAPASATRPLLPAEASVGLVDLVSLDELAGLEDPTGSSAPAEVVPPDAGLFYRVYRVVAGDTISRIANQYGVSTDSVVTFNDITNTRAIPVGRLLKIPSMNGILYEVRSGDRLESIATAHAISASRIAEINGLADADLSAGLRIFLPDARLSSITLREINGDLFTWPLRGNLTSWYGWRNDPFTGARAFHTGIDIGAAHGSSVRAAMEGRVSQTGYSAILGNFVMLTHHSGYSTVYAHLSAILVRTGSRVAMGAAIGRVGSTGYSTGPHLHFTIRKNGQTINPMTMLR
ncbi:MAG: hypothetical protein A2087_11065 [Spirochaetes bacterium GWD1_61_31]|nr:MAG: hypothetical protein A2004_14665 [Spirochaetes bacterium GWC1_61_12]OHD43119.1 MAG: hypothetical protein A2087_11065 [Spirochaetes bacterium GWD1_61_31]OHD44253.1 MAG: hypothetical protein A2Y35_06860 [Spirochaetes bacterium GWE1_60_18]OHD60387.1 MAG: hypothetical protein A2Y32_00665 [Spirochaetes bacterium GWF1_60_12]